MTPNGSGPRALALRAALAGSALWLLAGALLMPLLNDGAGSVKIWCGLLGVVAAGTLVLSARELVEARTRIAGGAGLFAALVLGAVAVLLWFMATPLP